MASQIKKNSYVSLACTRETRKKLWEIRARKEQPIRDILAELVDKEHVKVMGRAGR